MIQPLPRFWLLLLGAFFLCVSSTVAQISITAQGTSITTDFNTLPTTGTSGFASNGTITGVYADQSNGTLSNIVASNGGSGTGALYSFGTGTNTDRALGSVGSGTPGNFAYGVRYVNNTGSTITTLRIQYTGEQWRNSAAAAQTVNFSYLTSASPITTVTPGTASPANYTAVSPLNFTSPITGGTASALDGNATANRSAKDIYVSVNVPNGSEIMLRWYDPDHSGADHGLAIDDVILTPNPTNPFLSVYPYSLTGFQSNVGNASSSQSYSLRTGNLTNGITITAPSSDFQVSSDNSNFSGSVNLPSSTTSATIYVRLAGTNVGSFSGSVTNASSGAANANVDVAGSVLSGTFTKISAIQGSGNTVALTSAQSIEGIVTRVFAGSSLLNGFYVQEEDADSDGNAATSEGIFCFDPSGLGASLAIGDKVQVTGTPVEFTTSSNATGTAVTSSQSQLSSLSSVTKVGTGTLPATTAVSMPVAAASGGVSSWERYEGMLIQVSGANGPLTVTEHFSLAQFGQVTLSVADGTNQSGTDGRVDQYTQFNAPSTSGYAAYQANRPLRQIILDDASGTSYPATIIHARGGNPLSASNTLRAGDTVGSITTVLDERFEGYRLQTNVGVNFSATNARASIPDVGGTLKVGGANVLNYFTTFGGANDRGADNANEFSRQRAKVIANLIGTGSDIVALSEIQNNGYDASSAVQNLIDGLNASAGAGTWAFVTPNATASTDAITSAIIYKPAVVALVGPAVPIPANYGNGAFGTVGRQAIAQTFQQKAGNNGIFTLVANHWKSKGSSSGGTGDADAGDGQGFFNGTRTRQAQDLLSWVGTNPTGTTDTDYLFVGDFNAYAQEQPLTTITTNGYTALISNTSTSFGFRGEWGSLDHAFASGSLAPQVTGATKWYINADEPVALDYNTENKSTAQQSSLYNADQYRSADHDPLVVGLNLTASLPVQLVDFRATVQGDRVLLSWETTMERAASHFVVEHSHDGREFSVVGEVKAAGESQTRRTYSLLDGQPQSGTNYYRLRSVDRDGTSETSKLVSVTLDDVTPTMALLGNPVSEGQLTIAVRNMNGATYQLRTLTGQTIPMQTLQQTERAVRLQLGQPISAGTYLLEGQTTTTRQVMKVVIL